MSILHRFMDHLYKNLHKNWSQSQLLMNEPENIPKVTVGSKHDRGVNLDEHYSQNNHD